MHFPGFNFKNRSLGWIAYKVAVMTLMLAALVAQAFAQDLSERSKKSSVCGSVVDANGAAVPGASVRIPSLGIEAVAGADGGFCFEKALPNGTSLEVSMIGFQKRSLAVDSVEIAHIVMESKSVAEVVTVSAGTLAGSPQLLETMAGSFQRVSRQELEAARTFDFGEVLRKLPGVHVRDEEGFGLRPNISIRGTNPTRSSKVLLLEDGMPLAYAPYGDNASYYHPPVERFESIEVLKGSGQIEYGPVTVAGVVNYITPNPSEKPALGLRLTGGNRDFLNGNILYSDSLRGNGLVLNVNRKQGQGARDNTRAGLTDVSAKLVREIGVNQIVTFKGTLLSEDSQVTYSGLTASEFASAPRSNPFLNDRFEAARRGIALSYAAIISSRLSLTANSYVNSFSRDWWRQSSNSAQRPNRLFVDADCRSMADLYTTCGNEGRLRDYLNAGVEPVLTLSYNLLGVRSEAKAGLRYHFESQDRVQKNGDRPTSRDGVTVEHNLRDNRALSGFVHNRFIYGRFALTVGARVERIGYRRINRLNGASGRTELTQVIPGAGLTYNIGSKVTAFVGVHRGFAPPRAEDVVTNAGGVVDLKSELSWNHEAGVRTRLHQAVSADLTFFRNDFENQIVPASIAGGTGAAFTNAGKTLQQGVEVSARFDSSRLVASDHNVFVQFGFTGLLAARYAGVRTSSVPGFVNVSVNGNRLPYAPRSTVNAILGYSKGPIEFFVENNSISEQFSDDLNSVASTADGQRGVLAPQSYWNATLNYRVEKLKTTFFVTAKNLFDSVFVVDRSRGILPSSPRMLHGGFAFRF